MAGNILAAYGTKRAGDVRGLCGQAALSGALWFAGFFAIAGTPPFGAFWSELAILRAAASSGSWLVLAVFSVLLAAVFIGMLVVFAGMVQAGQPRAPGDGAQAAAGLPRAAARRETALEVAAPLVLLVLAAACGLFIPPRLDALLSAAARLLGAS